MSPLSWTGFEKILIDSQLIIRKILFDFVRILSQIRKDFCVHCEFMDE